MAPNKKRQVEISGYVNLFRINKSKRLLCGVLHYDLRSAIAEEIKAEQTRSVLCVARRAIRIKFFVGVYDERKKR